jgi:tRNA(Ile)-lysidine synthase
VRKRILAYIREQQLVRAGDRVGVAVSGGADSVALLRALLELRAKLGIVLAVAHFNHSLRGEQSDGDEAFVAELAKQHELEFFAGHAKVRDHATAHKLSIETAARELRYQWLGQLAREHRFDCIATAHTRDDQAETVLLKFLRGAGTRGLAGIYPVLVADDDNKGARIVRPLLCVGRDEVEAYLTALDQSWREDETNLDRRFLRNRVRHELLPLLDREYNPNIRVILNELADVSRAEEEYWESLVRETGALVQPDELRLQGFAELPIALQRRLLRRFAEQNGPALDFEHVEKLRRCALGESLRAELPGGRIVAREKDRLRLCKAEGRAAGAYRYVLPIPGEIRIVELEVTLQATIVTEEFARELPPGVLLSRNLLAPELMVRNWTPGDRYRRAHRGAEEKLKRIFAEARFPAERRPTWPLVLNGNDIVWVQGLPVASAYEWKGDGDAVKIEARAHLGA